ncbi:MAG: hypothetical protein D6725_03345 [Planctomycetota bacterium]|nr:MAG: hypothetical protein D6725_03345 [Planctomycetota bacterium]
MAARAVVGVGVCSGNPDATARAVTEPLRLRFACCSGPRANPPVSTAGGRTAAGEPHPTASVGRSEHGAQDVLSTGGRFVFDQSHHTL